MFCPGCKKEHLYTLSVCPACGVMAGDRTWTDPKSKIKIVRIPKAKSNRRSNLAVQKPSSQIKLNPPPSPILDKTRAKSATAELACKKTNRTLVEFQSKDGTVPEWRTQLRNAVRQRMMQKSSDCTSSSVSGPAVTRPPAPDDAFFDANEIIEDKPKVIADNRFLAKALRRIDESRGKYLIEDQGTGGPAKAPISDFKKQALKRSEKPDSQSGKSSLNFPPTPVYSPDVDLYDTSELDPNFKPAKVSSSFRKGKFSTTKRKLKDPKNIEAIGESIEVETDVETNPSIDEDRAPFAFRFNAALFDLLTASFASMVLLAPFMLLGGNWFTVSGFFGFLATCTLVSFIYLTTTIGLFGKSFGMHLFSIEMIDGQGEEYPSLHQAAVSSSVFLLSLAFGGAGFLTCLVDSEKRAIHDIVSNTLIVKEL